MTRGKFIVLEGADGAGTTSMSRQLKHLISRHYKTLEPVILTCEPSGGEIGQVIRNLLRRHREPLDWRMMSYLFMADRMQHVREKIRPALNRGVPVICDRYYPSTLVYQSASAPPGVHPMSYLHNEMRGFNVEPDRSYSDPTWLEPDLCLYLGVSSVNVLKQRRAERDGREMYEADETQKKVLDWYNYWYATVPGPNVFVDADADKETVRRTCWEHVCQLLEIEDDDMEKALENLNIDA